MGGAVVVPSIAMLTLLRPAKAVCLLGSAVNTEIIEVVTRITIYARKSLAQRGKGQIRKITLQFVPVGILRAVRFLVGARTCAEVLSSFVLSCVNVRY